MEEKLIEKTGHTQIKISLTKYLSTKYQAYHRKIEEYIQQYGGKEIKRSSRYVYFEINTNLLKRT